MKLTKLNSLFAFLLIISVSINCKKEIEIKTIKNSTLELAKIENHVVDIEHAKRIAVLNSIYPSGIRDMKKKIGKQTLGGTYVAQKQKPSKSIQNTYSIKNGELTPSLHIINYKEGGFVIVSGDDRTLPILAHSDQGGFLTAEN